MYKKIIIYIIFYSSFFTTVFAQIPARPQPPRLVNDYVNLLSAQQQQMLEYTLDTFAKATSNQICVVIVPDLDDYDPAQYAVELGHSWGVGQSKFDNGVVILVKPKIGNSRGEVFIAVGYGLEGAITDATARRIIEEIIIPHFKGGDYYGGIANAAEILMKLASGEITEEMISDGKDAKIAMIIFVIIFLVIFVLALLNKGKRGGGGGTYSSAGGWIFLPPMSGGSGSSFGSGSGGFGGFGGGRFGGGGAGGSW